MNVSHPGLHPWSPEQRKRYLHLRRQVLTIMHWRGETLTSTQHETHERVAAAAHFSFLLSFSFLLFWLFLFTYFSSLVLFCLLLIIVMIVRLFLILLFFLVFVFFWSSSFHDSFLVILYSSALALRTVQRRCCMLSSPPVGDTRGACAHLGVHKHFRIQ